MPQSAVLAGHRRISMLRKNKLSYVNAQKKLEARAGIEPAHKGFADLSLTTWVPRLGRANRSGMRIASIRRSPTRLAPEGGLERGTRFELATLALARRCSTTELLPLVASLSILGGLRQVKHR